MKQIKEIAQREIRSMFNSPVGWLILILFTAQSVLLFTQHLDNAVTMLLKKQIDHGDYTSSFFSGYSGTLLAMSYYLMFYLPFLTMGSMSREFSEGGIRLLFSSPIRNSQIVLGKFKAFILTGLLMIVVFVLLAVVTRCLILDSLDAGLLAAGFLNMYLVILLYAAIGLFISSCTTYQLVAAVGTFGVIFFLNNYLSGLVRNDHPEFIQRVFSLWLPPDQHKENFQGLVNLADILYYLLLITFFLLLTWLRLRFLRTPVSMGRKIAVYSIAVTTLLFSGWATCRDAFFVYYDFTSQKRYTPSQEQRQLMDSLPGPLQFSQYVNVLESAYKGTLHDFSGKVRTAQRMRSAMTIKPDLRIIPYYAETERLNLDFVKSDTVLNNSALLAVQTDRQLVRSSSDYAMEELLEAADNAYSWFSRDELLSLDDVRQTIDISDERYRRVYLLKAGPLSGTLQEPLGLPNEQSLTTAIKAMLYGRKKVAYIDSHSTRSIYGKSDEGYNRSFMRLSSNYSLTNMGFDIQPVRLGDSLNRIDTDILVIADPQENIPDEEMEKISDFIARGGNILITASGKSLPVINRIIQPLGLELRHTGTTAKYVQLNPDAVIKPDSSGAGILHNRLIWHGSGDYNLVRENGQGENIAVRQPLSVSVEHESVGFTMMPVAMDKKDTTIMALYRQLGEQQQRIMVCGDAAFLSNSIEGIGYYSAFDTKVANYAFLVAVFKWLGNDLYPCMGKRQQSKERLRIKQTGWLKSGLLVLMPLPFLLIGIRRLNSRRKN